MFWPELRGWDPLREMRRMQNEIDRLFLGRALPFAESYPPINIWSSENDILISAEMPGIDAKQIDISVKSDIVMLSRARESEKLGEGEGYHRQERSHGRFSRSLNLPFRVDSTKVSAKYEKGILMISLPRHDEDKPKKIQIKAE